MTCKVMVILGGVLIAVNLSACSSPQVDAYYYPDAGNLSEYEVRLDVGSVESCRDWVHARAASNGDPDLQSGDYECGIDPRERFGGITVYRETVR